jgi:hypothetical protein
MAVSNMDTDAARKAQSAIRLSIPLHHLADRMFVIDV